VIPKKSESTPRILRVEVGHASTSSLAARGRNHHVELGGFPLNRTEFHAETSRLAWLAVEVIRIEARADTRKQSLRGDCEIRALDDMTRVPDLKVEDWVRDAE